MRMVVAGIDVCKKHLDVSVDGVDRRFENDRSNWRGLHVFLRKHSVTRVVMEVTGCYHRSIHQSLHDRGYEVLVINPRQPRIPWLNRPYPAPCPNDVQGHRTPRPTGSSRNASHRCRYPEPRRKARGDPGQRRPDASAPCCPGRAKTRPWCSSALRSGVNTGPDKPLGDVRKTRYKATDCALGWGAGVVERGGLENRCARERTVGSNPTPTARGED